MNDRPPPGCVILLLFALVALFACGLLVSIVDRLTPQVAAGPVYQYAVCNGDQLRAYDGADGYVRAGRWVYVDPPLGGWTDAALPNVGKARLLSLIGCRVQVRDAEGVLVLTWDGAPGACRRWARNCSRRWCKLALDNGGALCYDGGVRERTTTYGYTASNGLPAAGSAFPDKNEPAAFRYLEAV